MRFKLRKSRGSGKSTGFELQKTGGFEKFTEFKLRKTRGFAKPWNFNSAKPVVRLADGFLRVFFAWFFGATSVLQRFLLNLPNREQFAESSAESEENRPSVAVSIANIFQLTDFAQRFLIAPRVNYGGWSSAGVELARTVQ